MLACVIASLVLLFVYSLEQKSSLTLDAHGLIISSNLHAKVETRLLVPWSWLDQVRLRKPVSNWFGSTQLEITTKYGGTHVLKWDEVISNTATETLLAAVKTLAPEATIDLTEWQRVRTLHRSTFTQLWLRSLSTSNKRQRTGPLAVGTNLSEGRYEVTSCLGAGGQGTAYLATDKADNQQVVLKEYVLPVSNASEPQSAASMYLTGEVALLSTINHEQVVKMLEHFVEDHRGYIVMEYVEGVNLRQSVRQQGQKTEAVALDLAIDICNIVEYLHALTPPVVHRDLTPDNFIMQPHGAVKLVDFNVARQFVGETKAVVVGKQAYMPPEQLRGTACVQSDIYSVGCTVHFLLTGVDPQALSVSNPLLINPEVSAALDRIVQKATAQSLSQRYASVSELKSDLLSHRQSLL
jgi:hypothetical protein